MKQSVIILFSILAFSCSTTKINKQSQQQSSQYVELGVIGTTQTQLTSSTFKTVAIPVLASKIRVQVTGIPFSKATYKSYKTSLVGQYVQDTVVFIDSLAKKPQFVNLSIVDQIGFVEELNSPLNTSVVNYLKNMEQSGVVTTISTAFSENDQLLLQAADEVYLIHQNRKKYGLEIYKSGNLVNSLELSKGIVFGYQLSGFCWGKTKKHKITIANLSVKNTKCERNTEKDPKKLIEKVNYFKFSD